MTYSVKDLERAQQLLRISTSNYLAKDIALLGAMVRREALEEAASLADGCIGRDNLEIAERIRALKATK